MKNKKRPAPRNRQSPLGEIILIRLTILLFLVGLALFLSGTLLRSVLGKTSVLGDSVYLTHDGENVDSMQSEAGTTIATPPDAGSSDISNDATVYCKGTEGKYYKTTYEECKKKNSELGIPLEFTVIKALPTSTRIPTPPEKAVTPEGAFLHPEANNTHETINQPGDVSDLPNKPDRAESLPTTPITLQTKDGSSTINVNVKEVQVKLEQKDGKIVVKAEREDGTEIELSDDALFHIEDRLAVDHIKIATTSAHEFLIQRNHTAAVTDFPLSWDLSINRLIVTTPAGKKEVAVLPDQAIQNLTASKELNQITLPDRVKADKSVDLGTILDIATLTHKNGEPMYQVTGITSQKLFGIFPVAIEKTVDVSGDSGKVIDSTETPINTLVDLISF